MALLSPILPLTSTPPMTSMAFSPSFSIRLQRASFRLSPIFGHSFRFYAPIIAQKKGGVIAMASAAPDEPAESSGDGQSEDKEDNIPIQNLPLESKLQLKLEQKMKMKIAKTIRLRRKRLMRKRMMRKKGRWPPSKMKKLKNV